MQRGEVGSGWGLAEGFRRLLIDLVEEGLGCFELGGDPPRHGAVNGGAAGRGDWSAALTGD